MILLHLAWQYIQQQIRDDYSNLTGILEPPEGQDEGVWKYEHLRLVLYFIENTMYTRDESIPCKMEQ